jgi:hypothetical protein
VVGGESDELMVTSSKILTVTYGTFSCTLEGFDDPFTTLQMVAEYFRKLAAEDRFFGSTPQTPDTDTLKRIAEENTSKGVNAELADDGIILRQTEETVAPVAPSSVDLEEEPLVFDSTRNDTEVAADDEQNAVEDAPAAPLTFFRSRRNDQDEVTPQEASLDVETPDEPEDDADARAIDAAITAAGIAAALKVSRDGDDDQPSTDPKPQKSVEETLAAIRQNVEQAESSIDAEIAEGETEAVEEVAATEEASEPLVLGDDSAVEEEEPQESDPEPLVLEAAIAKDEVAEIEDTPVAEPDVAEVVSEEEAAPEVPVEEVVEAYENPETADVEDEPTAATEEVSDLQASSLTDAQEAELAADLEAAMLAQEDEAETDDFAQFEEAEEEAPEETDEEPSQSRADILLGSNTADEDDGALDRLLAATQSKMDKPEQVRRVNALEQLKAAVAATEADRQIRRKSVAETHSEADEGEGEATDLAAYRDDLRRAQDSARLEGLNTAATPTPAAPVSRPAPTQVQQSPLILVSEQRIDEAPEEIEPVEPEPQSEVAETDGNLALKREFETEALTEDEDGEVQGIPADAFSDASSFSDFAERIGAFELTDLLEASAAYTSIVEARPRFSRAQVMSKLAKLNIGDAYTKEAGLRSFGKLLREGKILRVQDGQFAISKASRFSVAQRYND